MTNNLGADSTIECAGGKNTFKQAYEYTRCSGIVSVVAMYGEA